MWEPCWLYITCPVVPIAEIFLFSEVGARGLLNFLGEKAFEPSNREKLDHYFKLIKNHKKLAV